MTRQEAEKFLKGIGTSLKHEQISTLKLLERRAEENFRRHEKFFEIVTDIEEAEKLLPVELSDCIFFANQPSFGQGESKTLPYGPFFLCVPYEEFFRLLNKDFRGAGFTYQFKPNYCLVEAEEKFSRVARLYDVPLEIYSPHARRAVDICIFGEIGELDFKTAENNLSGKFLADKKFYRNAEFSLRSWDSYEQIGKIFEYRCSAADEFTFALPKSDFAFDDAIEIRREDGQIVFRTPREFQARYEQVKILPHENKIEARILRKRRLRTRGDIEFVLSGLARDGYSCRFGGFGGAENISRYVDGHKYFSAEDENLLRAKNILPTCTVKFSGAGIFLTDYANFVLHFLEKNYPEFNWAGERDD